MISEYDFDKRYSYFGCMLLDTDSSTGNFVADDYWVPSYLFGGVTVLLSLSMVYSLKLTWRKYVLVYCLSFLVTRRNTFEAYDQTYCIFTRILVIIILTGTPVCIVVLIIESVYFFTAFHV